MTKVQITMQTFFVIREMMSRIDMESLSSFDKKSLAKAKLELEEKHNKLCDRVRYGEMLKAGTAEEKKTLLDQYQKGKGMGAM